MNNSKAETEARLPPQAPACSVSEIVQVLRMANVNGAGRAFGGHILVWMDEVATVSARRYAHGPVTTACIDGVRFLKPAYQNETMVVTGRVVWTGRTSMEVLVTAEVESFDRTRDLIAEGRFIMVALDENERPKPVPPICPMSDAEERLYQEALARHNKR